ncbi:MAG TPA: hypothetical protein GXX70_00315 [Tepidimicrobium sp.]|nr:hypothetical protein [Tepidimicrobium sp.]
MDSTYDVDYIYKDIINKHEGIPIIVYNPKGSFVSPVALDKDFNPICFGRCKLVYWEKDSNYSSRNHSGK